MQDQYIMTLMTLLSIIASLAIGAVAGFYGYKKTLTEKALAYKAKMEKFKEIEEEMLEKIRAKEDELIEKMRNKEIELADTAHRKADDIILKAEQKAVKIEEMAEKDIAKTQERLEKLEEKILQKEEKLDEKKEALETEKQKLEEKYKEIDEIITQQQEKLSQISGLSKEEAKDALLELIKKIEEKEIETFVEKYRTIKKEEADKEAMQIIMKVMPRIAADTVGEYTVESVDIPEEHFKWKLIGREWRNIGFFEKTTGAELIVDDTPGVVRVSCYEHEKRFVAVETLKKLLKDGRINPFYIEKFYTEVSAWLEDIIMEKWKEALTLLNIPMMKPEIVYYVGRFHFRYSYGQNLRQHSIEVARICEWLAAEMGEDPLLAKKAWLLHDIGKVIAVNGESHTAVGADTLRKFEMHPVIINAAESHHYDIPMTHPISWIVTAADGISASRPGARFNTKDLFIEKMGELEKLIMEVDGVHKVHIMQAGREIMVYVNPSKVSDVQINDLIKTIGAKIESQLDYPGIIRMVCFRENKVIEYLR